MNWESAEIVADSFKYLNISSAASAAAFHCRSSGVRLHLYLSEPWQGNKHSVTDEYGQVQQASIAEFQAVVSLVGMSRDWASGRLANFLGPILKSVIIPAQDIGIPAHASAVHFRHHCTVKYCRLLWLVIALECRTLPDTTQLP